MAEIPQQPGTVVIEYEASVEAGQTGGNMLVAELANPRREQEQPDKKLIFWVEGVLLQVAAEVLERGEWSESDLPPEVTPEYLLGQLATPPHDIPDVFDKTELSPGAGASIHLQIVIPGFEVRIVTAKIEIPEP